MLLHCISTCIICDREPIVIFMYTIPLCITCLLAPIAFSLPLFLRSLMLMWLSVVFFIFLMFRIQHVFLDLWVYSFNPSWKIYGHYFFNYMFSRLLELFLSSLVPLLLLLFWFSSLYYIWIVSIFCPAIYDLFIPFHVFFISYTEVFIFISSICTLTVSSMFLPNFAKVSNTITLTVLMH